MRVYARKGLAVSAAVALGCLLAPSASTDVQEARRGQDIIKACVEKHGGEARIVPPGRPCRDNETALVWNIEGPRGPQGPAGAVGAPGASGRDGRDGRDGKDGRDGQDGGGTPAPAGPIGTLNIEGIHLPEQSSPILTVAGGLTSTDAPTGGVSFQEIHVTKPVDQFSPKLYMFGALGRSSRDVQIDVFRQGTQDVELSYRLTEVLITSIQQSGGGNQAAVESVSFSFSRIRLSFTPLGGLPVTFCYDVRAGRPC